MSRAARPDPGSFRDPLSRVVVDGDRVLRIVRGRGITDLEAVFSSGYIDEAVASGQVIPTKRTDASGLPDGVLERLGWADESADDVLVVEHERLPVISYPYEWTFSMLRDAALLQLDVGLAAFDRGLGVKDATPYNVQFKGSRPVFIDVGSFEELDPGSPWYGYRQFCEMYLNPLLLQSILGVGFQPWMRGSIGGISPVEMASLLHGRQRLHKGVLTHVVLHARSEIKNADSDRDVRDELRRAGFNANIVRAQMQGLRKVVEGLRWRKSESTWSNYSDRAHYKGDDLANKERFVDDVVGAAHRDLVWDLGANDGVFSRIAARNSDTVVAVDADPLVVDHLYKNLRAEGDERILPLYMNLIDSSPSQGWRGGERSDFCSRSRPDVVLALALVHHMVLPGNVPPVEVVAWLADMDAEVVLEIPHEDDPMVKRLLRAKREDLESMYSVAAFDTAIDEAFDVRRREVLPSGTRTLLYLTPRS